MNYHYERYSYYGSWSYWYGSPTVGGYGFASVSGYSGFSFDYSTGQFTLTSPYITVYDSRVVFDGNADNIYGDSFDPNSGTYYYIPIYKGISYSRGSYIDTVIVPDGTYPNDGVHGSYWYVRTTPILTQVRVGGAWKNASAMKIKVNNAWKDIAAMKVRVAGAWKTIY